MAKTPPNNDLNSKHLSFVAEYLIDLNGKQAAIRAGYSPKTAEVQASRLLSNAKIMDAVQQEMDKRSIRTRVNQDDVLKEIAKLSFSSVKGLFDEEGRLLPVHMLPDDIAASVSSVEVVTSRIPGTDPVEVEHVSKIKFWDKRGSLELLGKHLKLFNDVGSKENPLHIDKLADEQLDARLKALESKG